MKIYKINARKMYKDEDIKKLIAKEYNVPAVLVELSIWSAVYGTSDNEPGIYMYGYYIPKIGYPYPVVVQNEEGELIFIRKKDYDEYWEYLKADEK